MARELRNATISTFFHAKEALNNYFDAIQTSYTLVIAPVHASPHLCLVPHQNTRSRQDLEDTPPNTLYC